MSLDGLRAWIGEVERKLGMRTRVFLVLAVVAIGGAGAAVYLAIDTRENAVSESDVQALQEKLEARIAAGAAGAGGLEAEPEGAQPEGEGTPGGGAAGGAGAEAGGGAAPGGSGGGGSNPAGGSGKAGGASGGEAENGAADTNKGASKNGGSSSRLQELLEQTKEANAKAEREIEEKK